MERVEVARVQALYRFPVKSMRGERVPTCAVGWRGLEGDRRYAFVRGDARTGFPWLTARQLPQLLAHAPYFVPASDADEPVLRVRTPDGQDLPIWDDALRERLAAAYGGPVFLLHSALGLFDAFPLTAISEATLHALADGSGVAVDALRMRINLVLETIDEAPFQEDGWLGGLLQIGRGDAAPKLRLNARAVRCMMVNLHPRTQEQDPRVLRFVTRERDRCASVAGAVERPGVVRAGDPVFLYPAARD